MFTFYYKKKELLMLSHEIRNKSPDSLSISAVIANQIPYVITDNERRTT